VISHPQPTSALTAKYENYLALMQPHINRMKKVFSYRTGSRNFNITEQPNGRIDRRKLHMIKEAQLKHRANPGLKKRALRICKQEVTKSARGLSVGILLDESGSMGSCYDNPSMSSMGKAEYAMCIGVLLHECLVGLPSIEHEIYSHTTGGWGRGGGDNDTMFTYLYGKNNPHKHSIAAYDPGSGNYDYVAINCARHEMKKFCNPKFEKLLIVVSDGEPCGHFGGMSATDATKLSVDQCRKDGFHVLQIAIDGVRNSDKMYGKENVVHFEDLPNLIVNMRKFMARLIRNIS